MMSSSTKNKQQLESNAELITISDSDSEEVTSTTSIQKPEEPKPGPSRSSANQVHKPGPKSKTRNGIEEEQPESGPSRSSACQVHKSGSKSKATNGRKEDGGEMDPQRKEKFEQFLVKYMEEIEKMDEQEVDWDEEHNSAYLRKDRHVNKLMKFYGKLCKRSGDDVNLTGRLMQKKFIIDKVTRFPEIDAEVAKFLNRYCKTSVQVGETKEVTYSAPEYNDILDVVKSEIVNRNLAVFPTETEDMAKELFRFVIFSYKKRRAYELHKIAIPGLSSTKARDPADTDPELRRKLDENCKKRRNEEDVIEEFAEKQKEMPEEEDLVVSSDEEEEESSTEEGNDEELENGEDFFGELPIDSPPSPLAKKMKKNDSSEPESD